MFSIEKYQTNIFRMNKMWKAILIILTVPQIHLSWLFIKLLKTKWNEDKNIRDRKNKKNFQKFFENNGKIKKEFKLQVKMLLNKNGKLITSENKIPANLQTKKMQ